MSADLQDTIARCLAKSGIEAHDSWLFDCHLLGVRNGCRLFIRESELIYRVLDQTTILLVLYRKSKDARRSLSCSFSELFWFIEFLSENVPDVTVVKGLVDVFPYRREGGISAQRLARFYRLCGAEMAEVEGQLWASLSPRNLRRPC